MSDMGNKRCCALAALARLASRDQVGIEALGPPHRSLPMGLALQELQVAEAADDLSRHLLPIVDASNDVRLKARRRPHLPLRRRRHLLQLRSRLGPSSASPPRPWTTGYK